MAGLNSFINFFGILIIGGEEGDIQEYCAVPIGKLTFKGGGGGGQKSPPPQNETVIGSLRKPGLMDYNTHRDFLLRYNNSSVFSSDTN